MTRERNSYIGVINAAVFILLEIAAFAMLRNSSTLQNIWINRASRRVQAFLWSGGENIRNYFFLEKQNEELARTNFLLNEELRQYRAEGETIPAEIKKSNGMFRYTPATVVKMSRNTAHNYIIIDKGSEDGIKPQSGIITDYGVVGFVDAVSKHYSYGLTLMNNYSSVSARIGDTGFTGSLVWDGTSTGGAFLKDVPIHCECSPGDTIVTSGFSTIFPAGIPLGIAKEASLYDGSTMRISVDLTQDFSSIRYVTIVECLDKAEIEDLETRAQNKP